MTEMVERLDGLGRSAWIALMVVGFIVFWPIGLALLAFLIWSGRMACGRQISAWGGAEPTRWERKMMRMQEKVDRWGMRRSPGFAPTGNQAFDEYRAETIERLEEEAKQFKDFLERLRHAKDKAEFDQFMTERRSRPSAGETRPPAQT